MAAFQDAGIPLIEASGVPLCTLSGSDWYTKLLSCYQRLE
jgi:hypothetical protein